jgi:energy-coupling factor transporter transmembrane protein EcfT
MNLHPATRLLMWLAFALFLPWLGIPALALVTLALLPFLIAAQNSAFVKLLHRTRWLLLSIFLVYALATPGVELVPSLGAFSPTSEGLHSGGLQAWRLAILLAGLALVMAATPGKELLAGIYYLLRPLALLGVASDRIAARIWLTLYYAEQTLHLKPRDWRDKLHSALEGDGAIQEHTIEFTLATPSGSNWLALGVVVAALAGLAL